MKNEELNGNPETAAVKIKAESNKLLQSGFCLCIADSGPYIVEVQAVR